MPNLPTDSPRCPLCGTHTKNQLIELHFSQKMHLPGTIQVNGCKECDFAFVTPADQAAYAAYYASARTDLIHDEQNVTQTNGWINTQAPLFAEMLGTETPLSVLDYGCGGGNLIKLLAQKYPQHRFIGFDMHNDQAPGTPNVEFSSNLDGKDASFDLIIMSHVLEHFADLDGLKSITKLLKDNGTFYIEVPNPTTYADSLQREYLFFIDRMHLSHFSAKSMMVLAERFELKMQRYGMLALPYRDGTTYPSHYFFLKKGNATILGDIENYMTIEKERSSNLLTIRQETPVLIYGFGDNFFRCRSVGGPLEGRPILAVMDMRHLELSHSTHAQDYTFMEIKKALTTYLNTPIIITLTWGAKSVKETLIAAGANPERIYTV